MGDEMWQNETAMGDVGGILAGGGIAEGDGDGRCSGGRWQWKMLLREVVSSNALRETLPIEMLHG